MAVLVGIDEAGFGPILGPLVVSSSAFSLPKEILDKDMWQILHKSIGQTRKHLSGRLLIADSKKAHNKSDGIKHLERTTLACLRCIGENPSNLGELLTLFCPDSLQRLGDYPWYQNAAQNNLYSNDADLKISSSVLSDDLASNNIKLLKIQSRCLDVAYYNRLVDAVKNKSIVLFTAAAQLIKSAWDDFKNEDEIQILIDRQGGTVKYRKSLLKMFPGMELQILKETPANSSYELKSGNRKMRLHFVVKADDKFLPVSLASMVSKYLRELLLVDINHYFIDRCSEVKPTAGYWKDGLRFIADIKKYLPHIEYDSNQLIRCR